MKIRENCYMLGLGSTGGKIYKEFVQRHYKGAAANGSEQDHKALGDVPNKYILQGFDGFGGHRERAMDCLAGNEDFIKFVEGIKEDIVFILFAGGGSTGSGCAPIVAEMLLEEKDEEGNPVKTVCPVIALPASGESLAKHKNAYETVQELQEIEGLGATFFLNNDSNENYDYINKNFASINSEDMKYMEKQRNDLAVLQKNGLIHLIGKSENRIPEPKFKGGTVPWFDDTKLLKTNRAGKSARGYEVISK